ncbi:hypothetical protein BAE44_0023470 [Dichanthelium oligosanthes]|uniref:ABC1 atypical kinase-like domain-containing protein n=1 Tax=Dichanthelium oligosanthes TaxID=888268 RepID=A0A1E5URM3_9POAL|nr:hypothetical protein BAE44_0023470 [Dichanthelium oligosanthes]
MPVASAAAASLVASTSLSVPDHLRLRRFRLHPRPPPHLLRPRSRARLVRAVLEDRASAPAEEDAKRYGLNGNGSRVGYDDAAVQAYLGGNGNGNGSGNGTAGAGGNGAAATQKQQPAASAASSAAVVPARPPVEDERRRKERVEEIGREDAWFKQSGGERLPEVSVAPGGRWNRFKTYSTIQRTLEIWGFVFTFIFKAWLNNQKFTYRGGMTEEKKIMRRKVLAKWLKESILRLGPTFIKIGQQFSTRVDILPQEYVDQLSELQDQVPPFPSETAVKIVEEELGASVNGIFERFDFEPIAAASLGQVHRARLNGQEVVIKVQRPGLKELFDIDLKNLRVIAEYLQKVDPKSDGAKRDWVAIYDECASVLYQEIDYTKEAFNAEKFAENFKKLDYVKVPKIYWEYTTPQVLTMEYVPGIKINRIKQLDKLGVDRKRLGRYAVESYLEQILSHGFFHADPHPGNIAVDDFNGGRLIFYDFGMMGSFEERLVAQRKEREMATAEVGFKKQLSKEEKFEKKKQRLAAIGEDLLAIAADQPFRFPATFTFVVRAFSVLDGIGKGLDPRFDITEIAKPYAMELLRFNEAGVEVDAKKRWERQSRAFYNLFRQPDRVEKLAEIIERLEQGDLKLRVRTLESERAFQRVAAVQKTIGYFFVVQGIAAGSLVNLATMLYFNSIRGPATIAYSLCAFFGLQVLLGLVKVKKLDQQERLITGTA